MSKEFVSMGVCGCGSDEEEKGWKEKLKVEGVWEGVGPASRLRARGRIAYGAAWAGRRDLLTSIQNVPAHKTVEDGRLQVPVMEPGCPRPLGSPNIKQPKAAL